MEGWSGGGGVVLVGELLGEGEVAVGYEDVPALREEGSCEGAGDAGCAAWMC
jgi:hypothetical protein